MARVLLSVLLALAIGLPATALRSCTRAVVPCEDELVLKHNDRFLVTLFGHACYSIRVASAQALDAYFYAANDWKARLIPGPARALRAIRSAQNVATEPLVQHAQTGLLNWAASMQICRHELDCRATQSNKSSHAVYDLVIAKATVQSQFSDTKVFLRIESCDVMTRWFYIGLAATALGGFFTMLFLLCIISEYLLGIHTYSRLRRKLSLSSMAQHQFVELAQFDPDESPQGDACCVVHPIDAFALSATGDASELSDEDVEDAAQLQRNHGRATSHSEPV